MTDVFFTRLALYGSSDFEKWLTSGIKPTIPEGSILEILLVKNLWGFGETLESSLYLPIMDEALAS